MDAIPKNKLLIDSDRLPIMIPMNTPIARYINFAFEISPMVSVFPLILLLAT